MKFINKNTLKHFLFKSFIIKFGHGKITRKNI